MARRSRRFADARSALPARERPGRDASQAGELRRPPAQPGADGEIVLPASLAESLSLGHPWVYRDHVPRGLALPTGSWTRVRCGRYSAHALWDASSPIALRIFSRERAPDAAWFAARVSEALALRRPLLARDTNAFRLLYGEGDGVPGVTLDVYDRHAVIVTYADSLEAVVPHVVAAVRRELPLESIVRKLRRGEGGDERLILLEGSMPPERLVVKENGMSLLAELHAGQKTGLFLDHRDNREFVRGLSADSTVLNLFAYTGAFSVAAALGGARRVTSVDVAPGAVQAARQNFALNGLGAGDHEFVVGDVFDVLETAVRERRRYDLVINDPPSFAASRDKLYAALRAYARLHASGLRVVAEGGTYAAASCTSQVSPEAFRHVLAQAAERAGVRFQIFHDAGQPLDHPLFAGHPEGRYLKFIAGRVLGRA